MLFTVAANIEALAMWRHSVLRSPRPVLINKFKKKYLIAYHPFEFL
jgi:hypothetical protein